MTGGCLCGTTRYRLTEAPVSIVNCHCVDCRRSSGAPFVTWGSVHSAHLHLEKGKTSEVIHADRSRLFAPCCGTPLFFRDKNSPEWTDVTIATLDDPTAFAPEKAIWIEDRLSWSDSDSRLPAFHQSSKSG